MLKRVLPPQSTLVRISSRSAKDLQGALSISFPRTASPCLPSRYYSSLSKDEEEEEKKRVSLLSPSQKIGELKELDKEIARLNILRGINTGELYTARGKMKALARDYGLAFTAIWTGTWLFTGILTYGAIEIGGVDAIALIAKIDGWTGYNFSSKIDPTYGKIGVAIVVNELLEPLRLPLVISITKPIVDKFSYQ